jgi:hypothetical protein
MTTPSNLFIYIDINATLSHVRSLTSIFVILPSFLPVPHINVLHLLPATWIRCPFGAIVYTVAVDFLMQCMSRVHTLPLHFLYVLLRVRACSTRWPTCLRVRCALASRMFTVRYMRLVHCALAHSIHFGVFYWFVFTCTYCTICCSAGLSPIYKEGCVCSNDVEYCTWRSDSEVKPVVQ